MTCLITILMFIYKMKNDIITDKRTIKMSSQSPSKATKEDSMSLTQNICIVEGCTSDAKVKLRQMCKYHCSFIYKGKPIGNRIRIKNRKCSLVNCDKSYFSNSYCRLHYQRFLSNGDPNIVLTDQHGLSKSEEYQCWVQMRSRCRNPKHHAYALYGGRGIKICDRWLESFRYFVEDMGKRPSPEHSIDRINVDGNYEPSNCRWATPKEQALNRRPTKKEFCKRGHPYAKYEYVRKDRKGRNCLACSALLRKESRKKMQ